MKIGILSDTHSPSTGKVPPEQVRIAFEGVELILHAGDIYTSGCLDWLEEIAPVLAVDHVGTKYFEGDARVTERRVIEVGGYKIAMAHEFRLPGMSGELFPGAIAENFPAGRSIRESIKSVFEDDVDILVFGHTHYALIEEHQGVLIINPGSPSLPKHIRRLGTVAILDVDAPQRDVRLIELASIELPAAIEAAGDA